MRSLRLRSIFLSLLAAILVIIIAGCGGMSNSSPSNPASPPGGNSGGNGGGGNPQSSTFVYVGGTRFGNPENTYVFRFNSDGSTALVSGSPFTDPQEIYAQSGKFLIGHGSNDGRLSSYPVDTNTGAPQPVKSITQSTSRIAVADASNVYAGDFGFRTSSLGIEAFSVTDGNLTPVPGSPFGITPGNKLEAVFLTRSLLFAGRNSDSDGDLTVFSRSSTGALTRFTSLGLSRSFYLAVVHPSARFIYKLNRDTASSTLDAFSFDPNSGASALVQQLSLPDTVGTMTMDVLGRYLFVPEKGVRVFSIDQSSGKLTEVAGSPFFAGDTIGDVVPDPTGRFLLVIHGNTFQTAAIDAANGKLTTVAPLVTIAQEIGRTHFAVF